MKRTYIFAILILLALAGISCLSANSSAVKISEFSASDMPDDDGSGIILKWQPLPKENRVIKYNIYRGVSPDSLFLLTYLEVDPKLGVLAPYLYYYDSGDQPLIEFESSPSKLKKEKDQEPGSPLFAKFPLDAKLLSTILDRYSIFATTKAAYLHKHSKAITKDDKRFAGLKLTQFDGIYAIPQEGVTYYYSVAAVNERGGIFAASEVQSAVPVDNPPDATAIVHASYITELKQMNFEWYPPVGASDISVWQGWIIPKGILIEGKRLPENWAQRAVQIFEIPNLSAASVYYHSEEFPGERFDPAEYTAVLSYLDYAEQMAAVSANSFRHISQKALPKLPEFTVMDKANDKGDNMLVSFGKPLAYISLAEFTNKKHNKLKLNYDISENEKYTVDKIRFIFKTKDGEEIGSITENYVDKVIHLAIPEKHKNIKHIHAEIAVMLLHSKEYEPELVSQEVVYNDYFRRYQPQSTFVDGVDISKLHFDVLHKSQMDWDFSPGMRANALTRTYDHTIPFEDVVFRPVSSYDAESGRFLFNVRLGIANDVERGIYFDVPLYRESFNQEMQNRQKKITELEAELAKLTQPDEELQMELEAAKAEYDFIINHPAYKEAEAATSDKAWRKIMLSWREKAMRSYQYRLMATDTKSAFLLSEIHAEPDGNTWYYPISQWFDKSKTLTLIATFLMLFLVVYAIIITRRKEVYIRPIAGLQELDNAIGRATEMGRPVMFVPGWGSLGDVCTIASLMILAQVAKKTAEYDIRLINPHCDYMVLPLAQEIISTSYSEVGRPDSYNQNDIFFISYDQFPFCAGVNGITVRERVATIFYMGFFNAEALLLTETGNQAGAIQIAATDAVTQIPFFITTCDYTLIGEEFYAASAYLSRNHDMVSMLKAQDYFKLFIILGIVVGTVLSTLHISGFIHAFPVE
ncbi:MAG: hypothetical protein PHT37_06785 [Candidatus Cloacimonetes bacterium]|jgi:hypothetical protein|nr:hypothetical protein [Candidatus Cloacimonadota bacterium]MDY0325641.1 hypothetical protein [Candidatus Cloacimonadaceae bacterium]